MKTVLKEYVYQGRVSSGVTLRLTDGTEQEVIFHPGRKTPPLPDDNGYVVSLVVQKLLIPVTEEPAPVSASTSADPKQSGTSNGS
jgi:hypothetical protein